MKIHVTKSDFPENLFNKYAAHNVYILLSTANEKWVIRPFVNKNEIAYEFGRVEIDIKDYKEMANKRSSFDRHAIFYSLCPNRSTHLTVGKNEATPRELSLNSPIWYSSCGGTF